jgi:very-short-patch-repair endonuclease
MPSTQPRMKAKQYREMVEKPKGSNLEQMFAIKLKQRNLPEPVREYRPIPGRRFRIDFSYPDQKLAIELEGGTWSGGRHTRGAGFRNDCLKYALLTLAGWKVLRFTTDMVSDDTALDMVESIINGREYVCPIAPKVTRRKRTVK